VPVVLRSLWGVMFMASVALATLAVRGKELAGNVQWMMASGFFVLWPALARRLGIGAIIANQGNMDGISLVKLAMPSMVLMVAIIAFYFHKFGSFRHPAFWLLMAAHVPYLFVERIGDNAAVRSVLSAIFK